MTKLSPLPYRNVWKGRVSQDAASSLRLPFHTHTGIGCLTDGFFYPFFFSLHKWLKAEGVSRAIETWLKPCLFLQEMCVILALWPHCSQHQEERFQPCSECAFHNNLKQRIQEGASQADWKANRQKKIATVQFSILHWIPERKKYKSFLFFLVWVGFFALSIFLVIDVAGSPGDKSSLISCSTDNKVMYFTGIFLGGVRIFCDWNKGGGDSPGEKASLFEDLSPAPNPTSAEDCGPTGAQGATLLRGFLGANSRDTRDSWHWTLSF